MGRAGNNEVSCNNTMSHEKRKAIENNEIFLALLFGHFSPIINYSSSLFLDIGSVFIWFVFSSVHVYAVLTFLQNTPYGWKGEFSMLTSNKGGKYRELHVAADSCSGNYQCSPVCCAPMKIILPWRADNAWLISYVTNGFTSKNTLN